MFSVSIFDALVADIDDDDDLLLTIFPFDSSAFGELHLELLAGVDGDSVVSVVAVSLTVAVDGDSAAAVTSFSLVPIIVVFANKLLSSDRIDCNAFPLLILLLVWRSHTSSDFDDFCKRRKFQANERIHNLRRAMNSGLNEGITVSDVCLSDALILSGFRGGGSGASDAAITIPSVPFNCICQCTHKPDTFVDFSHSDLLAMKLVFAAGKRTKR